MLDDLKYIFVVKKKTFFNALVFSVLEMMQRHLQVVEESQRLTELLNRYLRFMCADAKRPHSRAVLLCVTLDCGPQNCD